MHLSVVDKDHMAVSITSTVNLVFGSRVLDTNTGIILNDEVRLSSDLSRPTNVGLIARRFQSAWYSKVRISGNCRDSAVKLRSSYFGLYPSPCGERADWPLLRQGPVEDVDDHRSTLDAGVAGLEDPCLNMLLFRCRRMAPG